jgi:hypothetical protein
VSGERPPEPVATADPKTAPAHWLTEKAEGYARDGRKFREAGQGKTRPILGRAQDEHWGAVYWAVADELRKLAAAGLPGPSDVAALAEIAEILRDPEWGVGMLEDIAEIVRATGRTVENYPDDRATWSRH